MANVLARAVGCMNMIGASADLRVRMDGPRARDLLKNAPVVVSTATNAAVAALFNERPELAQVPVVEADRPVGLIKRHAFMSEMAKPFYREVYERKTCDSFMERDALIVEADTTIEDTLNLVIAAGGKALTEGFVIVRDGVYAGVGTGLDLMRIIAELQAAKNRQVTQSIEYASVIQRAMLWPSDEALRRAVPDSSIVWQPRDIVGGDFYHCVEHENGWFLLLADCTGHGVPGSFMTLISSSWLTRALERHGPQDPARILSELNRTVKLSLGQLGRNSSGSASDDGLDGIALWFDRTSRKLVFASARTALHTLDPDDDLVMTIDGERTGVGYVDTPMAHAWSNRDVMVQNGTLLCISTDGLIDQIGGSRRIAFGKKRLRTALTSLRALASNEIAAGILDAHNGYQAENRRRDDLTFIVLRV